MIYLGILDIGQILVILTFMLIGLAPTIIALVDILKNDFTGNNKIVWVLIVLLGNFFGAVLYFLIGREQRIISK